MVQVQFKGYDSLTDSYRSEGQVMVNELTKGKQHQVPLVVGRGFRVPRQHIVTDHSWTRELSATFTCLARYVVSLNYNLCTMYICMNLGFSCIWISWNIKQTLLKRTERKMDEVMFWDMKDSRNVIIEE